MPGMLLDSLMEDQHVEMLLAYVKAGRAISTLLIYLTPPVTRSALFIE
jgi:hypothetical protein